MSSTRLASLLRLWTPVIAWMAVIFLLSSQSTLPSMPDSAADAVFKKSGHAVAYAILCFLAVRALHAGRSIAWQRVAVALLLSALYGISDELHQSLIPGRTPRVFDWLVDVAGAIAGAWLYARVRQRPAPPATSGHAGARP